MVTQLREHVWWIDLVGVNAFLVEDGDTLTLVDAGSPWDAKKIRRAVQDVARTVGDIDRILLTHYDIDHVGALARLTLDATVYVGRDDLPALTGDSKPGFGNQKELFQRAVDWLRRPPDLPIEAVDDGDEIGSFTAHTAPGHTPGHTVYVSEELSVGLLGDLVRESGGRYVTPPRVICHDYDRAKADIVRLAGTLPQFEAGCQGHGTPFKEGGSEQLERCAKRLDR